LNQGSFSSGANAYLYAVDSNGNVNSNGYPVKLGASGSVGGGTTDTTAPTISISSPTAGASVSGNTVITAIASDNVGVAKVEFYVNGALQTTDTSSPYLCSWNTSSLAAGTYTLMAKAYDAAGNIGQSTSVPVTVRKDDTAPTVSMTFPANNAIVSGSVTITANASDPVGVSKVEFYEDGALLSASNVAPYSYGWNTTSVTNTTHTLYAKAYDATGNVGQSSNITVKVNNPVPDTTKPTVSVTFPANNAIVSGSVTITANASDNVGVSKVEFYVNGVLQATDSVSPYTSNWNTKSIANGSYTITAEAYDAAGNIGKSSSVLVSVNNDKTVPTVSIVSPVNKATVTGTQTITASASDNMGVSKVEFYVNGVLQATDTASPYTFSWNTNSIANGSYTITAKAYDAAGNVGQSSNLSVTVSNNKTTPTVSITAPANNAIVSKTVSVTISASDNIGVSKVELYVNGILQATDSVSPYTFSWNTRSIAKGKYTLTAKAYDAKGNIGLSSSISVTVR
jgi:hypothetical protein